MDRSIWGELQKRLGRAPTNRVRRHIKKCLWKVIRRQNLVITCAVAWKQVLQKGFLMLLYRKQVGYKLKFTT